MEAYRLAADTEAGAAAVGKQVGEPSSDWLDPDSTAQEAAGNQAEVGLAVHSALPEAAGLQLAVA